MDAQAKTAKRSITEIIGPRREKVYAVRGRWLSAGIWQKPAPRL